MRVAQDRGWEAWGVEISPPVADVASERHGPKVFCGTLAAANFAGDFFDCVCLGDILEHVSDPLSFLSEASRVLKSGGFLYVAMPNAASLYYSLFLKLAKINRKNYFVLPHHVVHYTSRTLGRLLRESGFEVYFKASSTSRVMHRGLKGVLLKMLNLVSGMVGARDRMLMIARKKTQPAPPANVLYLSDTGEVIGGGQVSLLGLLERLDRRRFRPIVVVPQHGDFEEKLKQLDVEVICAPYRKIKNPLNMAHTVALYQRLSDWLERYSVDIVHSNTAGGLSLMGAIAAFRKKIPFLWHVRVSESGGLDDLAQAALSTRVLMISQAEMRRFPWLDFIAKGDLIYNGVDLGKFHPQEKRDEIRKGWGVSPTEWLVGTVGRFHPIKGYEFFVKAARQILQQAPGVKFLIVGLKADRENPYWQKIHSLVRQEGLAEHFIMRGPQDNVPAILSALDVFVLTSRDELFGRVLVEAMGCQVPVVAFDVGGVAEIVEDQQTGYIVPARDTSELCRKVVALVRDGSLRRDFGNRGRQRAEAFFDIETHVDRIEALYDRVRV